MFYGSGSDIKHSAKKTDIWEDRRHSLMAEAMGQKNEHEWFSRYMFKDKATRQTLLW